MKVNVKDKRIFDDRGLLRADKERLDWLEERLKRVTLIELYALKKCDIDPTAKDGRVLTGRFRVKEYHLGMRDPFEGDSLREAIDEARKDQE